VTNGATVWSTLASALARVRADISFAVVDSVLIALSYVTALGLRFLEAGSPAAWWPGLVRALPVILVVHITANILTGSYGHVWEHASIGEARRVAVATLSAGAVLILGSVVLGVRPVPLSVPLAGSLIALVCLGAVRFRSRLFSFRRMEGSHERAMVLGTGRIAADVARHSASAEHGFTVVGFIRPTASPDTRRLAGLPILGGIEDVPRLVEELGVHQVIVASERGAEIARRLVDLCVDIDVRFRIVPSLDEMLTGRGGLDIRDLELTDLLTRPPVSTDLEAVGATVRGKRVMVTGAGGSIGAEIVAQVLAYFPASVVAIDNDETHLHDGVLGWGVPAGTELVPALCDIRDLDALERLAGEHRPQVVFHAAAHKHVPILEAWPAEAVKTNVVGTRNLLDATSGEHLERFVLISTDKAADPEGVMGASKRLAEMLVQSAAADGYGSTAYGSVRFGNVLGSRGSVVPTFAAQIRRGGPVTVTDERMTRYFMTVGEAVELVLQAGALAEKGEIFVLDMGEPVRIIDLAKRLIRLSGLVPGEGVEIQVSGIRPGEKLDEILSHGPLIESSHPKIHLVSDPYPFPNTLAAAVDDLERLAAAGRTEEVRGALIDFANRFWDQEGTSRTVEGS
jgi:FlaA1/EpsC-like NDP-sugar epimerase